MSKTSTVMQRISKPYVNRDDNCLYCAIGNILSWHGIDCRDIDTIFDGQLDFYYARTTEKAVVSFLVIEDFPVNFILDKQAISGRMRKLMSPYGISAEWKELESYEESWTEIQMYCKKLPLVLFVDQYHMPYHSAYHKSHGAHFVTVLGCEGYDAYILDSMQAFSYNGVIGYDSLKNARSLVNDLSSIQNGWMSVEVSKVCAQPGITPMGICQRLQAICCSMIEGRKEGDKFWGLRAMNVFKSDLVCMLDRFGSYDELLSSDSRLERSFENLFVSTLRVAQQRRGLARFLKRLAFLKLPAGQKVASIFSNYERLHESWIRIRNQMYLAHRRRSLERMRAGLSALDDVITTERETVLKMYDAVERLASEIRSHA